MKLRTDLPKRFLRWWVSELVMLLPSALRERCFQRDRVLRIAVEPEELRVAYRERGRSQKLHAVSARAGEALPAAAAARFRELTSSLHPESIQIEITVSRALVLVKDTDLPAVAKEDLRQTLAFEMHRLTPFSADEVYFDYAAAAPCAGTLRVCLAAVPRKIVDQATGWLAGWTLRQRERSASLLPFPLTDESGAVRLNFREAAWRRLRLDRTTAGLLGLNALLAVAVVSLPFAQAQLHLERAEARLEETRNAVKAASAVRRGIDRFQKRAEFLSDRIRTRVSTAALIEELTARLPDTTWVSRLELRDDSVYLEGSSSESAALIGRLEESSMLVGPKFDSPVVRERNTGRDRFQIAAQVTVPEDGT